MRTLVWQEKDCIAAVALHQHPATLGSLLLFPTAHYENIYVLPEHLGATLFSATKALANAMKVATQCQGITVRQNNEPAGGQDVWHYHVHITPRWAEAGASVGPSTASPLWQRVELAQRFRSALSAA